MDYEKKYKDALEKARQLCAYPTTKPFISDLQDLFPELAESEDERIRKSLIGHLKECRNNTRSEVMIGEYAKWIAWLEKQGEQNLAWSEEDETTKNNISHIIRQYDKISKRENQPCYYVGDCLLWMQNIKYRVQPNPVKWSEEDEGMLYGVIETEQYMLDVVNGIKKFDVGNISIKEECTIELNWLKSLRDRVQLKQEWSEEDKKLWVHDDDIFLDAAKMIVEESPRKSYGGVHKKEIVPWFYSLKERLKSLRPQNTWKPSDEQMKVLNEVLNFAANHESPHWKAYIFGTLNNLIRQLKKLRDE